MKKTHWLRTTLITLVACGLAGLILAVILFNSDPGRTGAFSSVEFSFEGAAEGIAPNGMRYDLNALTSDEVLNAALEDAGMTGKYTAAQLRENIVASGEYPKDIVDQMTRYESLVTGNAGKVSAADYHATLYNVALYNDFDKSIARADLEKLLGAIMTRFRERFERIYSVFLSTDSLGSNLDLASYDYPQQLELLEAASLRYERYANQMGQEHPDFLKDGEGFPDIAVKYNTLRTSDLARLEGLVTINALSTNTERIASQYENEIRLLEISLKELGQEAEDLKGLIAGYSRDDIIYVSTTGSLQQVSGDTATYDALVAAQKDVQDQIAENNKELAELKLKLADIRGEAAAETAAPAAESEEGEAADTDAAAQPLVSEADKAAQEAVVQRNLESVIKKLNGYTEEFSAFLKAYSDREMNDSTVALTPVRYSTPKLLSGSFIKQAIKTAGPLCALGLMICLIGLIVSRVKEEKRAK